MSGHAVAAQWDAALGHGVAPCGKSLRRALAATFDVDDAATGDPDAAWGAICAAAMAQGLLHGSTDARRPAWAALCTCIARSMPAPTATLLLHHAVRLWEAGSAKPAAATPRMPGGAACRKRRAPATWNAAPAPSTSGPVPETSSPSHWAHRVLQLLRAAAACDIGASTSTGGVGMQAWYDAITHACRDADTGAGQACADGAPGMPCPGLLCSVDAWAAVWMHLDGAHAGTMPLPWRSGVAWAVLLQALHGADVDATHDPSHADAWTLPNIERAMWMRGHEAIAWPFAGDTGAAAGAAAGATALPPPALHFGSIVHAPWLGALAATRRRPLPLQRHIGVWYAAWNAGLVPLRDALAHVTHAVVTFDAAAPFNAAPVMQSDAQVDVMALGAPRGMACACAPQDALQGAPATGALFPAVTCPGAARCPPLPRQALQALVHAGEATQEGLQQAAQAATAQAPGMRGAVDVAARAVRRMLAHAHPLARAALAQRSGESSALPSAPRSEAAAEAPRTAKTNLPWPAGMYAHGIETWVQGWRAASARRRAGAALSDAALRAAHPPWAGSVTRVHRRGMAAGAARLFKMRVCPIGAWTPDQVMVEECDSRTPTPTPAPSAAALSLDASIALYTRALQSMPRRRLFLVRGTACGMQGPALWVCAGPSSVLPRPGRMPSPSSYIVGPLSCTAARVEVLARAAQASVLAALPSRRDFQLLPPGTLDVGVCVGHGGAHYLVLPRGAPHGASESDAPRAPQRASRAAQRTDRTAGVLAHVRACVLRAAQDALQSTATAQHDAGACVVEGTGTSRFLHGAWAGMCPLPGGDAPQLLRCTPRQGVAGVHVWEAPWVGEEDGCKDAVRQHVCRAVAAAAQVDGAQDCIAQWAAALGLAGAAAPLLASLQVHNGATPAQ